MIYKIELEGKMKKLFLYAIVFSGLSLYAQNPPEEDATQQYRDKKADLAIIHDAYYEAEQYDTNKLPATVKDAIHKFGFKENEIHFYTATRMNRFAEKVGNNIILLKPNFFLYLTDNEQADYIALQLAAIKAGHEDPLGGSHGTFSKSIFTPLQKKTFAATVGTTSLILGALHYKELFSAARLVWPPIKSGLSYTKNALYTKEAALIGACAAINAAVYLTQKRNKIKEIVEAEYSVIDHTGGQSLISAREKQVHWAYNNHSWLSNKWNKFLGYFYLEYNPESDLERLKAYIAQKENQKE